MIFVFLSHDFGMKSPFSFLLASAILFGYSGSTFAIDNSSVKEAIQILPKSIELRGNRSMQQVVVQESKTASPNSKNDGRSVTADLGKQILDVEFSVKDPEIAVLKSGKVYPKSNGTTEIVAKSGDRTATAKIIVSEMDKPQSVSFRKDVLQVISKIGCNSGACHGALAGKGGFRLSLRGYNPMQDFHTIAREARGRRIELSEPATSLFLSKPTGAISHKGGVRFETDSEAYKILSHWIIDGVKPPTESDVVVKNIEVLPNRVLLEKGNKQQVIVMAHFSDGRKEDVTRWSKFTSTNETVAKVGENGRVEIIGHGEGAVTAWYASKIAIARFTSPYPNKIEAKVFAKATKNNFIDELVVRQLKRLNLAPADRCSDRVFVRRVYLDLIGMLPTFDEVNNFVSDKSPDKRRQLIDKLIERPEFVDMWTYHWSDILLLNGTKLRPEALKSYYKWIRKRVEDNTPWDQFVTQILTAQGSTFENGATNFYALHQDPEQMAENASQAFLGLSIACAKCHNHPLEKWTNDQYYAFANLFSRVRAKGWGGDGRNGDGKMTLFLADHGELIQPSTGVPQKPTPLDGEPLEFISTKDRRIHLAKWLTSPDNSFFARSITNRVWAKLLGVGLVEMPDDMRVSNPASNEELLSRISQYLVDEKFNIRALIRLIVQSETYQRASKPAKGSESETRFYSRYYPRRLMAEILLDAVSSVTDVPTEFNRIAFPGADFQKTNFYPKGTRAVQLYDSAVASYFLKAFGRNDREISCECQRSNEPSMVQVLHISNGDTINNKLQKKGNRIDKLLKDKKTDREIIEYAYVSTVARKPTDMEVKRILAQFKESERVDRRILIEDLFWSLLSSREFLFNH